MDNGSVCCYQLYFQPAVEPLSTLIVVCLVPLDDFDLHDIMMT